MLSKLKLIISAIKDFYSTGCTNRPLTIINKFKFQLSIYLYGIYFTENVQE